MEYIGEHLLPGQIGHFCVVLSFVAALFSTLSFFLATNQRHTDATDGWRNLGRLGYLVHGVATLGVIASLFYILTGKMYEYQYAWANVSDDLPVQYVFSAFWKEQQGSFLLWSFWHIVLGSVLIFRAGKWETPVLTVIALAETVIASMILGLYFGDFRLGVTPFELLRDTMEAPIFQQADYLAKVKGNGLNPLLQNYWMTIHPPTLFLGFASTIVPFAFAIAGLWLREHKEWLNPALKWALFCGAILGTGILMGGVWAYEALSFAGYWAWDPVENSSLVPWLILVAGIHTNLVAKATGYSIKSTYFFYLGSFLFILYSTYLTRSGILGDSSVHSFTAMGLGFQLQLFIGSFALMAAILYFSRSKGIPTIEQEEKVSSREFWMFMGALVLLLSSLIMTDGTSFPVWNKVSVALGLDKIAIPGDNFLSNFVRTRLSGQLAVANPVQYHNGQQMWIAVLMACFTAVAQWLRYNEKNWSIWSKKVGVQMGIAAVLGGIFTYLNSRWINLSNDWRMWVLLFTAMFTIVSNGSYIVSFAKGNIKMAASAVSHLGFGLLLWGIMSTGLNKEWISSNNFAMEGLVEGMEGEMLNKNVLLMRDAPMPIKDNYDATYLKDTLERQTRSFTVNFKKRDENGNYTGENFTLTPNVMYDRQFTKVVASNPSTQHYWNYDIFTHVSSLPKAELDPEFAKQQEDSLKYSTYMARVGDTIFTKENYIVVEDITKTPKHPDYKSQKGDLAYGIKMKAYSLEDRRGYALEPMMYIRPEDGAFTLTSTVPQLEIKSKMTDKGMEKVFQTEEALQFSPFVVKRGDEFTFNGFKVRFADISANDVKLNTYLAEEGDVTASASLLVVGPNGEQYTAHPLYLIRGNQPFSLKDEIPKEGLYFSIQKIDPATGTVTIGAAQATEEQRSIPVEIAENAGRSDYIVLEAIVFPGIKLVWIGCLLMLFGMAISFWRRSLMKGNKD
jgi:cytochrome c-type biogenesis protein CcmF